MSRLLRRIVGAALVCALLVGWSSLGIAQQAAPTLKIGDPAPPLANGEWIQGDPVQKLEPGTIYVVEFWATWCGPCITAIPHLTEMQKEYQDDSVVFIGQNVWEDEQSAVAPFVKQMGEKMTYRVALDDLSGGGRGKMATTWMDAAGRDGIPSTFLIDKEGKIAWIGHPMALEPILKQVVAGTYDPKKQAEIEAAQEQMTLKLRQALERGDVEAALAVLDEYEAAHPDSDMGVRLDLMRMGLHLQNEDFDAAYTVADKIAESEEVTPQTLNEIAWGIATEPIFKERNLDVAEKMAARAVEMTEGKDGAILDTHARILFDKGEIDKAIELQRKAVAVADEMNRDELQATLDRYLKAQSEKQAE